MNDRVHAICASCGRDVAWDSDNTGRSPVEDLMRNIGSISRGYKSRPWVLSQSQFENLVTVMKEAYPDTWRKKLKLVEDGK